MDKIAELTDLDLLVECELTGINLFGFDTYKHENRERAARLGCGKPLREHVSFERFQQSDRVKTLEDALRRAKCDRSRLVAVYWESAERMITRREAWPDNPNMWHGEPDALASVAGSSEGYEVITEVRFATRHFGYDHHGIFCSLRCGYNFGVKAAKGK